MTLQRAITASLACITTCVLVAHFLAPYGLFLAPVAAAIAAYLLCFRVPALRPLPLATVLVAMLLLQDAGLKLFAGGKHDPEGQAVLMVFFLASLIVAFAILLFGLINLKLGTVATKLAAVGLFVVAAVAYHFLTHHLGLGRYYWYSWNNY